MAKKKKAVVVASAPAPLPPVAVDDPGVVAGVVTTSTGVTKTAIKEPVKLWDVIKQTRKVIKILKKSFKRVKKKGRKVVIRFCIKGGISRIIKCGSFASQVIEVVVSEGAALPQLLAWLLRNLKFTFDFITQVFPVLFKDTYDEALRAFGLTRATLTTFDSFKAAIIRVVEKRCPPDNLKTSCNLARKMLASVLGIAVVAHSQVHPPIVAVAPGTTVVTGPAVVVAQPPPPFDPDKAFAVRPTRYEYYDEPDILENYESMQVYLL